MLYGTHGKQPKYTIKLKYTFINQIESYFCLTSWQPVHCRVLSNCQPQQMKEMVCKYKTKFAFQSWSNNFQCDWGIKHGNTRIQQKDKRGWIGRINYGKPDLTMDNTFF